MNRKTGFLKRSIKLISSIARPMKEKKRWHKFPMLEVRASIDPMDIKRIKQCYEQHIPINLAMYMKNFMENSHSPRIQ